MGWIRRFSRWIDTPIEDPYPRASRARVRRADPLQVEVDVRNDGGRLVSELEVSAFFVACEAVAKRGQARARLADRDRRRPGERTVRD